MEVVAKIIPGARKREVMLEGEDLKIKLTAPPVEGKANRELIEFLAKTLRVRRSEIKILKGEKDRKKLLQLPVDRRELEELLTEKARVTTG